MHPKLFPSLALTLLCLTPGCRETPRPPKAAAAGMLALAPVPGNVKTHGEIASLQEQLRRADGGDAETWARLARTFVRLARETGDPGLYAQADDAVVRALALDGGSHSALQVRQMVLLNSHRFVEARALAEEEIRRNQRDEVAWGTLGDSLLELGRYEGAMEAYQTMMDMKPDLRSYNRGAWMRWLIGDGDGAAELMQMAIDAGSPRDLESRSYCRVQLGDLHFLRGQYKAARGAYEQALREFPRYAPAFASRGRLNLVSGQSGEAVADLATALSIQPTTAVRALYVDALLAIGRDKDAAAEVARMEHEGRREDPRSLSLFYSTHDQMPQLALQLAKEELDRRPDIWSLDATAWALYRNGKLDDAWIAIQAATRLGTRDPRLLFHRGRIAAARNDHKEAIEKLREALGQSPSWDLHEPREAREVLSRLEQAPSVPEKHADSRP